jgi:hypothetical protein
MAPMQIRVAPCTQEHRVPLRAKRTDAKRDAYCLQKEERVPSRVCAVVAQLYNSCDCCAFSRYIFPRHRRWHYTANLGIPGGNMVMRQATTPIVALPAQHWQIWYAIAVFSARKAIAFDLFKVVYSIRLLHLLIASVMAPMQIRVAP